MEGADACKCAYRFQALGDAESEGDDPLPTPLVREALRPPTPSANMSPRAGPLCIDPVAPPYCIGPPGGMRVPSGAWMRFTKSAGVENRAKFVKSSECVRREWLLRLRVEEERAIGGGIWLVAKGVSELADGVRVWKYGLDPRFEMLSR